MRHPSCQLVVSATENHGSREGSWVFGWEGPADAVCVVVMYRLGLQGWPWRCASGGKRGSNSTPGTQAATSAHTR